VNQELSRNPFIERAFWVASGLAVVGAVLPLVVTIGQSNRLAATFWPFAAAAIGMGALAVFYERGRAMAGLVYFLSGLALAYGMLLLLSVPIKLAVLGSCPRPPTPCNGAVELQLSPAESTALTIAVAFGVMSLLAGFVALSVLYRQRAPAPPPAVWPEIPPAPKSPPAPEPTPPPAPEAELEPVLEPEPVAPAPSPKRKRTRKKAAPAPVAEPAAETPPETPPE
jgi:hypothetical protein